jgi:hypothetical protein
VLVGVCLWEEVVAVEGEAKLPEVVVVGKDEEDVVLEEDLRFDGQLIDRDLAGQRVFHVYSAFLQFP